MSTSGLIQGGSYRRTGRLQLPVSLPLFSVLIVAIATLQVVLFTAIAPATQVLRPHSDMYDLIDAYFAAEKSGDWLRYLLQPHSYHRIPWFRSLLALDIAVFKGTGLPFLVSAFLCMAGIGLVLTRQALAAPAQVMRLPAVAAVASILISSSNVIHLSVPANTPYLHTLFFSVLALYLAEPKDGADRSPITWRRVGALLCVFAAAFSTAIGFVLWPTLAIMAVRRGAQDRRWLILLLAVGGAFSTAYVAGLTVEDSAASLDSRSLLKALEYFVAFLGLPWTRASLKIGCVAGAVMLGFSLLALAQKGSAEASRHQRFAQSLVLFSLGTAAMAALGRQDMAEGIAIPGRYNLLLVPMKVGLVLMVLPWLERNWRRSRRLVELLIVLVFVLRLGQQMAIAQVVVAAADNLRTTITAFHEGARTETMKLLIYPDLARADALHRQIHERGLFSRAATSRGLFGVQLLMKVRLP